MEKNPHSRNPSRSTVKISHQQKLLNQNQCLPQRVAPTVGHIIADQSWRPIVVENTSPSTLTRENTPSSFSAIPTLASHVGQISLDQLHQTLVCSLFPREAFTSIAAICTDNVKNNGHRPKQPPCFNQPHFKHWNWRFNNHQHPLSSSGQNTNVLQFVQNSLPTEKI